MTKQRYGASAFYQQGVATLTVSLILSFLATLMTFYTTKVQVMEQRIAGNEFRADQAFAAAEAGIAEGIAYLQANANQVSAWSWIPCNSSVNYPCGNGTQNITWSFIPQLENSADYTMMLDQANGRYSLALLQSANPSGVFLLLAQGQSADGSGQAIVKQGIYLSANIPQAALMVKGNVTFNGNSTVDANAGQAISIWANKDVKMNGGSTTGSIWAGGDIIMNGSYTVTGSILAQGNISLPNGNTTATGAITSKAAIPDFPTDLFNYVFGVPQSQSSTIQAKATSLTNCDSLNQNSSGLYWITGNCNKNGSGVIGSADKPVLLVVNGNITMNGDSQIYGLVFSLSGNVTFNGKSTVTGSLITSQDTTINGSFNYDSQVLKKVSIGQSLALITGSWADF
ncbi:hypothetical conserved protein [Candidatus Nitrosoglobus terrae]|uniref:Hypothetical conserved protein n=1 Tax=Candidatus Nitrosoglobus terrae TaxID=1630141 RepID=A0A1Q2SM56_9GAMM|nr:PilX N-terminal domain-containing pilus assembly protein [Candidatus Nitrosoglobus terrae]BAW80193.1 hypothetical conserved protein [Candidatus Nitrosoglobus terrae]